MRRLCLAVMVVGMAVVSGVPGIASAQTPGQDSVSVTEGQGGTPDFAFQRITVDATSGPSGESPAGQALYLVFGVQLIVGEPATCVQVDGNSATMNFQDESGLGREGIVTVQVSDAQPDTFDGALTDRAPTDCSPLPPTELGGPLIAGDIRVHDALTRPEARAACRAEREQIGRRAFRAKYGDPGRALRNCIDEKRA
jgi:hypothetical protein